MAEQATLSLCSSDMKDPAALFERYSTEEIRRIERKVRGDIEQKKEELRQMVGERYRDLIDAADTIREMSQSAQSVVRAVHDMGQYCHSLKHGPNPSTHTPQNQWQLQENFYIIASEIALLLEIPERIWSAMEACRYLQATQLYLLCCHLHSLLHLETTTGGHYSPVLARFPILVRQVSTIGHFRSTILLESRSVLRGRAISDQAIAEALVSTMLLEGSSPRQALADFLLARKASIHQLLNQPQHGAGIKAQVCSLVELLVTTLFQAYAVFYLPPEGRPSEGALSYGLLFSTLQNATSTTAAGKGRSLLQDQTSAGSWFKYLPESIIKFQPTLRTLAQPIQREQLRDTLLQWIHTCKEDIGGGVGALLLYVKSLKGLAGIRDAVWELLSTDSISQHWATVCEQLLECPLLVWDDLLHQLFLHRLQDITKEETELISASSVQLLSSELRELEGQVPSGSTILSPGTQFEVDVASFVWWECAGDLQSDAGWVCVAQRGQQQLRSGLAMKTQALTPSVHSFCSNLDMQLQGRLRDLQHYLPSQDTCSDPSGPVQSQDCPAEEALRDSSLACVRHILTSIRTELSAVPPEPPLSHLGSVLFVARLCQSMAQLCPSLRHCILGKQAVSELSVKCTPRQSKKLTKGKSSTELSPAQAKWAELQDELLDCSMQAYRIWSNALSNVLLDKFGKALRAESAGSILTTATNWEDLEIQEEAESGSNVTSKIRLPVQPSWFVQSLLFQLCVEVNRMGGHALPQDTLQELLQACLSRALQYYQGLSQRSHSTDCTFPTTQNRALQLLFDLRYISTTLGSRLDEGKASRSHQDLRIQELYDWLESFIDPFDLDVFTPPLNTNLTQLSQRTSVLFGLLCGSEKQYSSRRSSLNSQEPYNILPLASSQIRFGLLPLSSSNLRKAKSSSRCPEAPHPLEAPSTSVSEDSFRPGSLFRQLAQQDEDTATPSLFKLSWLSAMAK